MKLSLFFEVQRQFYWSLKRKTPQGRQAVDLSSYQEQGRKKKKPCCVNQYGQTHGRQAVT